ncbi:MFS transporter, NNP family, nitrate/nitrite transporter [Marinactinospora thermotolerans DSM 45154]|uniref:MFS transporter, NNP family, nitrate/nitrite transporter n=1 Tax=Marinactinospora thermotolerans DSM 45154 TaxID=1122192 RepID=A0A1T4SLP9_9ACTN|nr:MFS transporter [Marinactinospora thermotolerans]SKA29244.1 MFS transporter, NNP family, nitrate/nitrite transporter [Marinactinospora thermotolerans DSM 45154]
MPRKSRETKNPVYRRGSAGGNLAVATLAFAITFWAWNLIGPLAGTYTRRLDLSPTQTSLLIAIPVLVGSLGRIPVGALTDRYGGRVMFTATTLVSIVPVLLLALPITSYPLLLTWGLLLGIAGTTFAIGIPFVNAWHPPHRRGYATGVFGAGMGGTAVSAFLTPHLANTLGTTATHLLIAALLALTALATYLFARDAPTWTPNTAPLTPRLKDALRLPATWQTSALYALAFGGFVAFSTYLPTLLQTAYHFAQTDAGLRTAGFSIAAVAARPLGGVLADRIGPVRVCLVSFVGTALLAIVLALHPPAELPAGIAFVLTAFVLGLGTGGIFALLPRLVPSTQVGTVTGLVGAAGGLGGYFPPLVMGVVYQATGAYTIGFALLAAVALATAVYTARTFRRVEVGNT